MKTKKTKKLLCTLIILFIFSFTMLNTNIPANAKDMKSKNVDLVILFNDNNIDDTVKNIVTNSGGKILNEFSELGGIEVECPSSLIPKIKAKDSVQSLSPNHAIKLSSNENTEELIKTKDFINNSTTSASVDLYSTYQWDIKRVTNNGESYNLESGNHDVVVGILDSGVDTTHPDLVNNLLGGKNYIPAGFENDSSETGDPNDITDRLGHGTSVAGEIAANGRTKGIAPNIGFKSYRIFNKTGHTSSTIFSSAIIDAANDNVKVINLSMGSYDLKGKCYWTDPSTGIENYLGNDMAEYSLIKRAIKYAINKGVTVVVSAGNEGQDCSDKKELTNYLNKTYGPQGFRYDGLTYISPASIKGVITVSATGKDDSLASYSNYGKGYIDITAPGGDKSKNHEQTDMCLTTSLNSSYAFRQGTSFSAPKVAAVAALILSKDKELTPKEVAKKIYKSAGNLDSDSSSKYYGAGMVNAYNAIKLVSSNS